jgi:hypothetical protein
VEEYSKQEVWVLVAMISITEHDKELRDYSKTHRKPEKPNKTQPDLKQN